MKKPRAYFNVLKFRLNIALRRTVVSNYPLIALIEPTTLCNLGCPACPTGLDLKLRPKRLIDEALFQAIIDEIGDYVFMLYMYNWGEPFLHKQTPELIKYAKAKEMRVVISSNLSVPLSDDYIERLVLSGLDDMIVSLDGTSDATYIKYRRRGNFGLVRENMQRIQTAKARLHSATPNIIWQFLVFRHNEHEIEQAQAVFRAWGADQLNMFGAEMPFAPYNKGFEPSTLPQYNFYHPANDYQRRARQNINSGRPCSWLYGVFVMNPNGKVSPCCAAVAEKDDFSDYQIGEPFSKVYNSSKFQQARDIFRRPKPTLPITETVAPVTIKGMAGNLQLSATDSICAQCPIPFDQDAVLSLVGYNASLLTDTFRNVRLSKRTKLKNLFLYALMGMPGILAWVKMQFGRLR